MMMSSAYFPCKTLPVRQHSASASGSASAGIEEDDVFVLVSRFYSQSASIDSLNARRQEPPCHCLVWSELDTYIEYWGMDTLDYKIGMLMKQQLYQHAGKRLISIYPRDLSTLDGELSGKLERLSASAQSTIFAEAVSS